MSSETWVKRKTWVADWNFYQIWSGKECIADFLSEERADQIIADRKALQTAREALEFYANWDNWDWRHGKPAITEEALVAEKALQAMKEQGQ